MSDQSDRDLELERLRARVSELERADAEKTEAEQQLRRLNAKLRALLENTDDFILFSDRKGRPLFFNTAYAQVMKTLLGIDMRPGLKPHDLLPDEQVRAQWDEHHRRVLSGEKFTIHYEHPLPDGSLRYFEVRYNPVREDGEIIGFSEFTYDITKYKLSEQALRDSNAALARLAAERGEELHVTEARYRALAEYSTDIVTILDHDRRFNYCAPSIRRYGYQVSDVIGATAADFIHPNDVARVEQALDRANERPGKVVSIDVFRVADATGDYVELEGQCTCLFDVPGIDGIVLTGRDISKRRRLEERLRQVEKMDAIGQLAGGIAHDFNNQLTGILANADLLRLKLEGTPLLRFAEQVIHSAQRSADLTKKLLVFARKGSVEQAPTDLNKLLEELVELLERSLDKGITIDVALGDAACITVGDPTLIHNAILNLALNARDAMPNGGQLTLTTALVVLDPRSIARHGLELSPGLYVKVTVRDDGTGMDEATQRRMFDPFFTTKAPGKGTGMGLASVYGTAEAHGGAVVVTSAPGEGTRVELYLPASEHAQPAESNHHQIIDRDQARILVIDDEQMLRDTLADLLGTLGHEVHTCADGVEALEVYRQSPDAFDLVVLDMIMPRMSGRETLHALLEIDPNVRALVISGFSDEGTAQQLMDEGARGFLHKPFDVDGISRAIRIAQTERVLNG